MDTLLARVVWTDWATEVGHAESVASVVELDAMLDRLHATFPEGEPVLVTVVRGDGDSLAIGIGPPILYPDHDDHEPDVPLTVLTYVSASGDPPYYNSLAAVPYPGDLAFFYNGQDSEFDGGDAIPLTDAREAVRRFVTGTGLPGNVTWQEV